MKTIRRKFLKLISQSCLSIIILPYNFLYSATKKIFNQNLTKEQKKLCSMSQLKKHLVAL